MSQIDPITRDYRIKASDATAIAALLILLPFSINNFIQGRLLLGLASLLVVGLGVFSAIQSRGGRFYAGVNFVLFAITLVVLGISIHQQGMIGLFWCFPVVPVMYFLLNEKPAWIMNTALLLMAAWYSFDLLDQPLALRMMASLAATSLFSAIFLRIINIQQSKLATAEESRREGMAGISHELRTPLALLIAQSDAMLDGIRPIDRPQLESLSGSLAHLSNLVEDMYQLALADVNALDCELAETDLVEVVQSSLHAAYSKLEEKQFEIISQLPDKQPVIADSRRLRQIVDNLLENCYRYTRYQGIIRVSVQKMNNDAQLVISDDGPGMDDQSLASVFDRFYRVDPSRHEKTGGAGLGLALVSMLAELQRGSVRAFHSPEGGFGIAVRVPLARSFQLSK